MVATLWRSLFGRKPIGKRWEVVCFTPGCDWIDRHVYPFKSQTDDGPLQAAEASAAIHAQKFPGHDVYPFARYDG